MRILLIGGFGYIGKNFLEKFSKKYDIGIFSKDNAIHNVKEELLKDITVQTGTLEDENLGNFINSYKPDIVIHLAAMTGLKRCQDNPKITFQSNVYGTFNVIKSCIDIGARLVFASSFEVYGITNKYERGEEDFLNPTNTYSITKMLGEELVKNANRINDLDFTILRISNVYGPEYKRGINGMIKSAIDERKIRIFGRKRFKNFIYIDDVVEILDKIINDHNSNNQIFNIGSEATLNLEEIANMISRYLKTNIELEYLPENKLETDYRPSLKKSKSYGYYANTSFDEGLKKTINWYLENKTKS